MTRSEYITGLIVFLFFCSNELLFPFTCIEGMPILTGDDVSYTEVAEIFDLHCIACHNGPNAPLDLRLDNYGDVLAGSEDGPVVVAEKPQESELILRVRGLSEPRMPFSGPPWLSEAEIAVLERWITAGMPEPHESAIQQTKEDEVRRGSADSSSTMSSITYDDVAPIFKVKCVKCHARKGLRGPAPENLHLNDYDAIITADYRARVVSGNPEASELVRKIRGQSLPRMPLDGPPYLNDQEIALITAWIRQGAPDSNGNRAPIPQGAKVRLRGHLDGRWTLDGLLLLVNGNTRLKKNPSIGNYVEVRGRLLRDGGVTVERIRRR